jgi:monofunctional biosynthetic peptidoglycan transglycosylase
MNSSGVRWVMSHKILSLLILLLAFVVIQAATIPWFGVPRLKDENPGQTSLMRQRLDEARENGKTLVIRQSWVPLARLPKHLTDAIIVAEDGTFYTHAGFDWFEVRESIEKNLKVRRAARGGSTITQQLAKNLYLSTSKDPLRKGKEMIITMLLEKALTKQRILELYVNVIEWGNGVFGVDAAARRYFGKPAPQLTLEESLRLAAVIPSPLRHRPDQDSRYVMRRAEIVRKRMESRRFIPFPADEEEERASGGDAPPILPDSIFAPPADTASAISPVTTAPADEGQESPPHVPPPPGTPATEGGPPSGPDADTTDGGHGS